MFNSRQQNQDQARSQKQETQASNMRVMDITPEVAAEFLRTNHLNRPLKKKKIAQYTAAMSHGKWKQSYDPVRFGRSGRLIDGQHRMLAIIAAGVTLPLLVIDGIEDSAYDVFDTGAPRRFSDVLAAEGYHGWIATTGAAATQLAIPLSKGQIPDSGGYSNDDMKQFVFDNPNLMNSVEFMAGVPRHAAPLSHSCGAALHFCMTRKDADMADSFFRGLYAGEGLKAGDVLLELRNKLIGRAISKTGRRKDAMAAVIRVWNSIRVSRPIKHINNAFRTDTFPEIR